MADTCTHLDTVADANPIERELGGTGRSPKTRGETERRSVTIGTWQKSLPSRSATPPLIIC